MSKTKTILVEVATLLSMKQQAEDMGKTLVGLFLMPRISAFFKNNGAQIESAHKKMKALQTEYYVVEDGAIKKDDQGNPVFQEGKSKEEFEAKWDSIMKQQVPFKI